MSRIDAFESAPTTEADHRLALDIHDSSRANDQQSSPVTGRWIGRRDRGRNLTVGHYDADFDLIATATGEPCEWIVARGTAD